MAHHASRKVYSLHAPEVECIGKGNAHRRYEFGVKVSIATMPLTRTRVIVDKSASPTAKSPQPLHRVSPMQHLVERINAPSPVEQKLSLLALFPVLLSNPPVLLPNPGATAAALAACGR